MSFAKTSTDLKRVSLSGTPGKSKEPSSEAKSTV